MRVTNRAAERMHDGPPRPRRRPRASARLGLWLLPLAGLLLSMGCSVSPLDLKSKRCPCSKGWTCVAGSCVQGKPGGLQGLIDAGTIDDNDAQTQPSEASIGDAGDAAASPDAAPDAGPDAASPDAAATVDGGTDAAAPDAGDADAGVVTPCLNYMTARQRLYLGEYRCSTNGLYRFGMSLMGELQLLRGDTVVWSAANTCCGKRLLALQGDGNLVVYGYTDVNNDKEFVPLFDSKTAGKVGASLVVEDDGRALMWLNGKILWSTDRAL